ncbi:unnamed protein product [Fusarium graminearum]|nr:unnamed protein product [Fusarium graminearum]
MNREMHSSSPIRTVELDTFWTLADGSSVQHDFQSTNAEGEDLVEHVHTLIGTFTDFFLGDFAEGHDG